MSQIIYPITHLPPVIPIGVQTENGVKDIGFGVSGWLKKWPDMKLYVWVTRPTETAAYPAAATLEGDVLVWHVSEGDTDIEGLGTVEIEGVADGVRALTGGCTIEVKKTTKGATAEPPDPIKDWHDRLMEAFTGGGTMYVTAMLDESGIATVEASYDEVSYDVGHNKLAVVSTGKYKLYIEEYNSGKMVFANSKVELTWNQDGTATWAYKTDAPAQPDDPELADAQVYYTADGEVFTTLDGAIFHVRKEME